MLQAFPLSVGSRALARGNDRAGLKIRRSCREAGGCAGGHSNFSQTSRSKRRICVSLRGILGGDREEDIIHQCPAQQRVICNAGGGAGFAGLKETSAGDRYCRRPIEERTAEREKEHARPDRATVTSGCAGKSATCAAAAAATAVRRGAGAAKPDSQHRAQAGRRQQRDAERHRHSWRPRSDQFLSGIDHGAFGAGRKP
jgi:hypothetical protein